MKQFKWHGIPVNVPDSPKEWTFFGAIMIIDLLILMYVVVFIVIM
mgnify:CR=1 FL=1